MSEEIETLIVGAGPVGLCLATELVRRKRYIDSLIYLKIIICFYKLFVCDEHFL